MVKGMQTNEFITVLDSTEKGNRPPEIKLLKIYQLTDKKYDRADNLEEAQIIMVGNIDDQDVA